MIVVNISVMRTISLLSFIQSGEYKPTFEFSGGRVIKVVFDVAKDTYVNVEKAMAASMARD